MGDYTRKIGRGAESDHQENWQENAGQTFEEMAEGSYKMELEAKNRVGSDTMSNQEVTSQNNS